MTKMLKFAPQLELPVDALTQTFAFLARRGAGKTYGASKLCEEMIDAGGQVVVLDPVGNWYGLRISADGAGKGFSIPVLGGLNGDIPLESGAGAVVADMLVASGTSAILDVSMMRKGERKAFATAFAEQFFHQKKSKKTPVHLFIEEAQVFVPQRVQADEARMLGAFEDLVKLGRNFGIGVTLISQRPQAVNKDALNQTECLVVLQTNGSQERKALRDWIVDQGLDVGNLIDSLPGLQKGEAWVWSPSWLGITKRIHIGKKRTLNASATPTLGDAQEEAKPLAPIDLEQLRAAMIDTVKRSEAEDPKLLKKRVADLERQLAAKPAAVAAPGKTVTKVKEVPVALKKDVVAFHAGIARMELLQAKIEKLNVAMAKAMDPVVAGCIEVAGKIAKAQVVEAPETRLVAGVATRTAPAGATVALKVGGFTPATGPSRPLPATFRRQPDLPEQHRGSLGKGERAVLTAVAQHEDGVSRDQLSVLTGYKRSTRDAYLQRLLFAGLVEQTGNELRATERGADTLGTDFQPLPTGDALREHWLRRLPSGEGRVLETVLRHHPDAVNRESIGEATAFKRSTRDAYIQRLIARRLVVDDRHGIRASDTLFGAA